MPFVNKSVEFGEFVNRLHKRIQRNGNPDTLICFEVCLKEQLQKEVKARVASGWNGHVNAGDFDVIYPVACEILHDAASSNFSECHPNAYAEAHAVSLIFCDELNELFQCSGDELFDLIPIMSYVQIMEEAGLVNVTEEPDGNKIVSLSEQGERVAREVEQQIDQN